MLFTHRLGSHDSHPAVRGVKHDVEHVEVTACDQLNVTLLRV